MPVGREIHHHACHPTHVGVCEGKPSGPISEEEVDGDGKWFWDLKCNLVEMFHWSLREIDLTDIESLIPFLFRYPQWKEHPLSGNGNGQAYADQVNWM